ncbi:MAG: hypothetical protein CBB92_04520 [Flammeovirgaceae bacterium TMED32]|nr:MAG: hypothetical protein CBB92_04520 [Flammeovirgaceae bacterium TMED32]
MKKVGRNDVCPCGSGRSTKIATESRRWSVDRKTKLFG